MVHHAGKYERKLQTRGTPYLMIPLAFFLMECFAFLYLKSKMEFSESVLRPLAFGLFWAVILGGFLRLLPRKISRITFGVLYGLSTVYAVGQTGYYQLFSEMMWLSEFRYASEGADYLDVLLSYPVDWFVWIVALVALGCFILHRYPEFHHPIGPRILSAVLALVASMGLCLLPDSIFQYDSSIRFAQSDYGRMQSAEAAYRNMFNTHRLYQVCGLYQTLAKDIYSNAIFPLTPGYLRQQREATQTIDAYFEGKKPEENAMTGLLAGKNVVLVLMESMDDWMIGEHTPTISRLMEEGIQFSDFYTPPYGGIRTFNTEFCINTGSFLSSQGGYAFDYVTNEFNQSLSAQLTRAGYSAMEFHYNDPSFYSRGVFSQALGYEEYVDYGSYLTGTEREKKQLLYDDTILFTEPSLREVFFRKGQPNLNFVITRAAHLSYQYKEVLSNWGLRKYPGYRGLTGNEETDCALLKARLVDDFFAALLTALEEEGELQDTVIIGVTDHYTYGYKNTEALMELSGVEEKLMLEKTPCFIWTPGIEPMVVDKTLNTSDFLPTFLNLLGVKSEFQYMGSDAFDDRYPGYVLFSDGSWITGEGAYDAAAKRGWRFSEAAPDMEVQQKTMTDKARTFTKINNMILETDYYQSQ